ncbi:surfeit locus protein 5 subunit 22 of mediator complex-domain-containing protein [Phellopilus nigrolimitatus]|nr:surfeit locus protein 5 subunit 22 of mediator complex-domain-containing protein [Phellopilus nigrolimitatus]
MADITQTDVSRPSALPTARLRPSAAQAQSSVDQNSDEFLDFVEEEWNKKVDVEVETLVDGMVDIVNLASIRDKDKFSIAQESFQAQCRAESMVRAAHSLLSITHSMKLLLLLSDESQIAQQRDSALKEARSDAEDAKNKVAELLNELLGSAKEGTTQVPSSAEDIGS